MTTPASPPRPARFAADVAKSLALSGAAKSLLTPTHTPREFFDALKAHPAMAEDAIRFLAAALPKREAVWWALACVRSAFPKPLPEAAKAIATADAWVKEPTEMNRRVRRRGFRRRLRHRPGLSGRVRVLVGRQSRAAAPRRSPATRRPHRDGRERRRAARGSCRCGSHPRQPREVRLAGG